ncbi:hypothetical protein HYU17_05330 [Candidatus Woesearchaeota archaeon]|nr:hypothetical protein [Candidatus Woesearchaeota archaeon]
MTTSNRQEYEIKCHSAFGGPTRFVADYKGRKYGPELEQFTAQPVLSETIALRPVPERLYSDETLKDCVKPELSCCQFEVTGAPHESLSAMYKELLGIFSGVQKRLVHSAVLPLAYAGHISGINPKDIVTGLSETPHRADASSRYKLLASLFGNSFVYYASRVASDQLNIGGKNEEDAFRTFNLLRTYLPVIAGFSAASPFTESGNLTSSSARDHQSQRLLVYKLAVEATLRKPLAFSDLIPPPLESLEDYVRAVEATKYPHPNTFYHLIRPMPHRGVAAEIRVMDKQPSLADTMAMFALIKGITESEKPRKITDLHLEQELEEAVCAGIFDLSLFRETLIMAKAALPNDERQLLLPLEGRLQKGTIAERLQAIGVERGHQAAIYSLIEAFRLNRPYIEASLEVSNATGTDNH